MLIINNDILSLYIPPFQLKKELIDKDYSTINIVESLLEASYTSDTLMPNEKKLGIAVTIRSIYTNEVFAVGNKCVFTKYLESELNNYLETYIYIKQLLEDIFDETILRDNIQNTVINFINIINTDDSIFLYFNLYVKDDVVEKFKVNNLKGEFIPIPTFTNFINFEELTNIILPTLILVKGGVGDDK